MNLVQEPAPAAGRVEPPLSGPVVRTTGLAKRFGRTQAVDGVDLEVYAGDIFGLLGPNGAGKTTIIRMLLGLIAPTKGRAEVFGHDPQTERAQVLGRLAAIVESPALYPNLSGRDNLQAMALASGVDDPARVATVLEQMGLTARAGDRFGTYSLGMKQRLCIAAALLTDPQVLILDEPTNGLDPAGMADIRRLILGFAQEGRTVFLSSHLLHEVQQVCNRVAVLARGHILAQGRVTDLLASNSAIRVRVAPAEADAAWQVLQSSGWAGHGRRDGEYLVLDGPPEAGAVINRTLAAAGIFAGEITPHGQSLEDYYMTLTGAADLPVPGGVPAGGATHGG